MKFARFLLATLLGLMATAQNLTPEKILSDTCDANKPIFNSGRVHFVVVLYDFDQLSSGRQEFYRTKEAKAALKAELKQLALQSQKFFNWDAKVTVKCHGKSCPPKKTPFSSPAVVDYDRKDAKVLKELVVLVNLVFKPIFEDYNGNHDVAKYSQWSIRTREAIEAELRMHKAQTMASIIVHRNPHHTHHAASTENLYRRTQTLHFEGGEVKLTQRYYYMQAVSDTSIAWEGLNGVNELELMSAFACSPSHLNAIPYEYKDSSGKYFCKCRCPVGQKFERTGTSTVLRCVQERNESDKNKCGALAKCYSFRASFVESPTQPKNQCELKVFEKSRMPCPWDNYVAWHQNPAIGKGSPQVTVKLRNQNGAQTNNGVFSWAIKDNFASRLDKHFTLKHAGIYDVTVSAHDFSQSAVCKTQIRITDDIPPTSLGTCPKGQLPSEKPEEYNSVAVVKSADAFQQAFTKYHDTLTYGVCEDGGVVSRKKFIITCLGGDVCFDSSSKAASLKLQPHDEKFLSSFDILTVAPPPKTKKCIDVRSDMKEDYTEYSCSSQKTKTHRLGCRAKRCYDFSGKDLYTNEVEITEEAKAATKDLMDRLDEDFDAHATEIHVTINEPAVGTGPKEGTYTVDLRKFFDVTYSTTPFGEKYFDGDKSQEHLRDIVKCKYSVPEAVTGEKFMEWYFDKPNIVVFDEEYNNVEFSCWTKIGFIASSSFKVIVHPNTDLDICEAFSESTFYQTFSNPRIDHEDKYCNLPQSDFSEITFDFINDVGRPKKSHQVQQYRFWRLTCYAAYDMGNGEFEQLSFPASIIANTGPTDLGKPGTPEQRHRIIKRFGVNLRTSTTTSRFSRVSFKCNIQYRDLKFAEKDPKAYRTVSCPHKLVFEDCDKPEFPVNDANGKDVKDCEDMETCFKSCKADLKPYQYCGPNNIHFKENVDNLNEPGTTFFTDRSKQKCCTTPDCKDYFGSAFTCKAVNVKDEPTHRAEIRRCEPEVITILSFIQSSIGPNEMLVSSIFLSTLAVIGFAARTVRARPSETDQSQYLPLL